MSKQVLKTILGYAVTYHSDLKVNPFVITQHGKRVERFGDFYSCVTFIAEKIGNFEKMEV